MNDGVDDPDVLPVTDLVVVPDELCVRDSVTVEVLNADALSDAVSEGETETLGEKLAVIEYVRDADAETVKVVVCVRLLLRLPEMDADADAVTVMVTDSDAQSDADTESDAESDALAEALEDCVPVTVSDVLALSVTVGEADDVRVEVLGRRTSSRFRGRQRHRGRKRCSLGFRK